MERTKEYYFVLSTMPRLHARSRLLELGVLYGFIGMPFGKVLAKYYILCNSVTYFNSLEVKILECNERGEG